MKNWNTDVESLKYIFILTLIYYLVTSKAFWTFACTDPNKSAPIFFRSWVSSTNSQSCRSSLWTWIKSTNVSKNMLNTCSRGKKGGQKEKKRVGKKRSWCLPVSNSQNNVAPHRSKIEAMIHSQAGKHSLLSCQNLWFRNLFVFLEISTSCNTTEQRNAVMTGAILFFPPLCFGVVHSIEFGDLIYASNCDPIIAY